MRRIKKYFYEKIGKHFIKLLKQGITPHKLSLTIALAFIMGIFPVLGSTTILCGIAAILLGLNLPAIQLVNFLIYPLQLILLIPFYKAGEILFNNKLIEISLNGVLKLINENIWGAIQTLWAVTIQAIVVWLIIAPVLAAIIYLLFLIIFKNLKSIYDQKFHETPTT